MKRLLWAVAGAALAAGTASAEPPPSGKERTFLEQEFHLTDRPSLKPSAPGTTSRPGVDFSLASAINTARHWVLESAAGRLDMSRTRPDVW